jgi:hypothetical protein
MPTMKRIRPAGVPAMPTVRIGKHGRGIGAAVPAMRATTARIGSNKNDFAPTGAASGHFSFLRLGFVPSIRFHGRLPVGFFPR